MIPTVELLYQAILFFSSPDSFMGPSVESLVYNYSKPYLPDKAVTISLCPRLIIDLSTDK